VKGAVENVAGAHDTPRDTTLSPDGKTLYVVGIGAITSNESHGGLIVAYATGSGGLHWHHIETGKHPGQLLGDDGRRIVGRRSFVRRGSEPHRIRNRGIRDRLNLRASRFPVRT
jgi:hypothetical protein